MDSLYGQLNFGLDLNLDIEAQKETKSHGTDKLYKLKMAKKFEHIMFAIIILEVVNGVLLWLFLYLYQSQKRFLKKLLFKIVLPDTQHILDKEALIKPKAQVRPKVFNLVMERKKRKSP